MSQFEGVLLMPLYMYQAGYTAEAVASQIAKPQDRLEAVRPAFRAMGATIKEGGFSFGEYDVVVLYEAPDDLTAAALALAIAAGGGIRSAKTTRLLSSEEWVKSLEMAQESKYKPPPVIPDAQLLLGGAAREEERRLPRGPAGAGVPQHFTAASGQLELPYAIFRIWRRGQAWANLTWYLTVITGVTAAPGWIPRGWTCCYATLNISGIGGWPRST